MFSYFEKGKVVKGIEEIVRSCSSKVVEYIRSAHMVNMEELEGMIALHFRNALETMLRPEDEAITERMERLIREQANPNTPKHRKTVLNTEINKLAAQRKQIRKAIGQADNFGELVRFKTFVRKHFGDEIIEEFYQTEPHKPMTTRIDRKATMVDPDNPDRVY